MTDQSGITGIDHIDIVVENPEAMAEFLLKVGFSLHRRTDHGGGSIELSFPGQGPQPILELTARQDGAGRMRAIGLRHLALQTRDLGAALAHFAAVGLTLKGGPRTIPETGRTLVNLVDPEGGTLQIVSAAKPQT